jgi:SOS-response transcriptional repressor LexA
MATATKSGRLTKRQRIMYQFMRRYQRVYGRPPTLLEMSEVMETKHSNGVLCHIAALIAKGFVKELSPTKTARKYVAIAAPK